MIYRLTSARQNVGSSGGKPVVGPAIVVASSCLRIKIILKHSDNYCWVIFIVCVTNVCQRRCLCLLQPLQKSWSDVISLDYLFAVSCRLNDAYADGATGRASARDWLRNVVCRLFRAHFDEILKFFFIGPHKSFSWIQYGFLTNFLTKSKIILKGFRRVKERWFEIVREI